MKSRHPNAADWRRVADRLKRSLKNLDEVNANLAHASANMKSINARLARMENQPEPDRVRSPVSPVVIQQAHDVVAAATQQTTGIAEAIGHAIGLGAIFFGSLKANLKKDDGLNRMTRDG
jgi:hypothetical protein